MFLGNKEKIEDKAPFLNDSQQITKRASGCSLEVTIGANVVDMCYIGEVHNDVLAWGKDDYLDYEYDTISAATINALNAITESGLDLFDPTWYIDGYGIGSSLTLKLKVI
ncbi:MAG: hypothetical protein SH848_02585 [Saprospiraceae bacterium]|nr:hypothetical protein [Saprospiraceae bacterium]MDZ4702787.1 hypothetical protein [Saprospiraceae bacterium]